MTQTPESPKKHNQASSLDVAHFAERALQSAMNDDELRTVLSNPKRANAELEAGVLLGLLASEVVVELGGKTADAREVAFLVLGSMTAPHAHETQQ